MGNKRNRLPQISVKLMRKRLGIRAHSLKLQKLQDVTKVPEQLDSVKTSEIIAVAQSSAETETLNHRADVWGRKNVQTVGFMKCVKCGTTNETNPELAFYKFPCPNLQGTSTSAMRCRAWAEYCWPDKVLTPEELMTLYKEKQLLCSRHFLDKQTTKQYGLQPGVPVDLATLGQKNPIVRTYGKKVGEKTDAVRKSKRTKPKLGKEGNEFLDHNFLEGENAAELFETIDEIFEDGQERDFSMYAEIPIKQESSDTMLHEGYKCDVCLLSISGYRYTCLQCDDVDLCATCEANGAHAAHYVLRIPRPRPEHEVEELLKELRDVLKNRPPSDAPVEKIVIVPRGESTSEDPLHAPVPPETHSTDQSESDDESTDSESEKEGDSERPNTEIPLPANTTPVTITIQEIKDSQTREQIEPLELVPHEEPKGPYSRVPFIHLVKSLKTKKPVKKLQKRKTSNLVSSLKEKLDAVLNTVMSSEIVQQAKAQIETEVINKYDVKLEIEPETYSGKGDVKLGENKPSNLRRSLRKDRHLRETIREEPLEFVTEKERCDNDPLDSGTRPAKARKLNKNVQIVTVQDALSFCHPK